MNHSFYKTLLDDVTVDTKKHPFISISGTNKCGKTTFIKLLCGIIQTDYKLKKKHIGVIFATKSNFIHKTVDKVLDYYNDGLNEVMYKKIVSYLSLNKLLKRQVEKLTTFELIKVQVATELLKKNTILIIDDLTVGLTKLEKKELFSILKKLVEEDIKIIYTCPTLEDTIPSSYLCILDKGKIVLEGKPLLVLKEDTTLNKIGLELPFMIDFSIKLIDYDMIENIELDLDRMVDILWK